MRTLNYQGFNKPCTCHYGIGELSGKKIVVFVQGPLTNTSITNTIEALASRILSTDLAGTNPQDVRFFEHYPPALRPLVEWQEVTFGSHVELGPEKGPVAKLLGKLLGTTTQSNSWAVDEPAWTKMPSSAVPPEVLAIVAS